MPDLDTLPKYLLRNFHQWGDREIAIRKKKYGIWNEYTWKEHYQNIKHFCLGLVSLGFTRGDKVSVLGDADPEWTWAQLATMAAQGAVAGIFTDCLPAEVKYIVEHSDSKFLVAHDQEQVDKALEIKDQLPLLKKVIYWEPKGMRKYEDPILAYFYDVIDLGKDFARDHPNYFEDLVAQGSGQDVAMLYYTSGTTGLPKGAIVTHKSLLKTLEGALEILPAKQRDDYVAVMPPAWMGASMTEAGHLLRGLIINYPEKPETAMEDLREISPYISGGGPRIWEGLVSLIQSKIIDAGLVTRILYKTFLPVGYRVADFHLQGKETPLFWKILHALAELWVFRSLRNQLGFRESRHYLTGSAAMSPDTSMPLAVPSGSTMAARKRERYAVIKEMSATSGTRPSDPPPRAWKCGYHPRGRSRYEAKLSFQGIIRTRKRPSGRWRMGGFAPAMPGTSTKMAISSSSIGYLSWGNWPTEESTLRSISRGVCGSALT
jgi:long-chain acyl-CoA synthetase